MAQLEEGYVRLDDRKRLALGRYTEREPGAYFRVVRSEGGVITLTPTLSQLSEAVD